MLLPRPAQLLFPTLLILVGWSVSVLAESKPATGKVFTHLLTLKALKFFRISYGD